MERNNYGKEKRGRRTMMIDKKDNDRKKNAAKTKRVTKPTKNTNDI